MRRTGTVLTALAVLLLVLAAGVRFVLPGVAIRYPGGPLDKTATARGQLTLYLDPATAAPQPTPQVFPLAIARRLRVLDTSGSRATVREDDQETIGQLKPQTFVQQYVVDRATLRDVASPQAFAYQSSTVTDRSPAYAINLPFGAGAGPYPVWKNEVGRSYDFRRTGTTTIDGVALARYQGSLTGAAVQPVYVDALAAQGIPKALTPVQAAAQLKAQGADPALLQRLVLPRLAPADRSEVSAVLGADVPLRYSLDVNTSFLVEPRTGAIVSLDRIDQTLFAAPDITGISRVQAILAKPAYASDPTVQLASKTIGRLVASPPTSKVIRLAYSQTPASVSDLVAFTAKRGDKIDLVRRTIPLALLIGGLVLLAVGLALRVVGSRRATRHAAYPAAPSETGSTGADRTRKL